jgi:hypothetical protein
VRPDGEGRAPGHTSNEITANSCMQRHRALRPGDGQRERLMQSLAPCAMRLYPNLIKALANEVMIANRAPARSAPRQCEDYRRRVALTDKPTRLAFAIPGTFCTAPPP